jgi:hypothetical protein
MNDHEPIQHANNVNIRSPPQRVASQVEKVERIWEESILVMHDLVLEESKVIKLLIRGIDILTEHISTLMFGHEDFYAMVFGLRGKINEHRQVSGMDDEELLPYE